jgi:hypothetical protein
MDCRKWIDLYSTDSRLKYPSEATQKNYQSVVTQFLFKFSNIGSRRKFLLRKLKNGYLNPKQLIQGNIEFVG